MTTIISSKSAKVAAGVVGLIAGLAMFASSASAYTFSTNLKVGSTGVDVKNLQMVLNMNADTQVSATGAGSPGNETSYFGPATKAAVIKFQNKYASDILAPVGLTKGTGFVGASTRAHLNTTTPSTTTTTPSTTTTTTTTTTSGPVSVTLSNDNPTAGAVVAGQATADLLHVTFTGTGTITNVKLLRTGVSSNATLTNVYLYKGNTRVGDAASVNNTDSTITFNGLNVAVNGSLTLSVKADIAALTGGQIIGVQLTGYTVSGGTMTTANISGNYMNVAQVTSGTMTAVTAGANTVTGTPTVDAGTTGYTFWSSPITVSNRAGSLKGANFKIIGSAPADALANIHMYVNGSAVGPVGTVDLSTNLLSFDFGSSPVTLNTGASTIDVRADVVKGSFRTVTISLANAGDLIVMDSQLGVNVAPTNNSGPGASVTINKGSVTTSVDSSYNATTIAGGTTGANLGQFTMKAYGEDVKVSTLQVTFATTTVTTLNNVSLFVNGSQVGSSANFVGQPLSYTLGSSMILPANKSVTVKVTADVVDSSGAAYTSGTIAAVIGGVGSNAQGQSSSETLSVAGTAVTGNTLTVGSGVGTFVRTSGFVTATTSPNTNNVKIGSFTLQAGSSEGINVNSIGVNPAVGGYNGGVANAITNYTNLTVKTSSGTVLGTPVGSPALATSTFSFSDIAIPVNESRTFDVFADIGAAASSTANPTVTAAMQVTYRGVISNTTTVSSAAGVAIASASASLSAPTLVSSSPVIQYVVGGSTMGIATFKLKTGSIGTSATVTKLSFTTTGTDAIQSITVGGVTSAVIGSGAGATTTVSGLNIAVPYTGVDVPVTVKFSGFLGSTTGGSLSSGIASVSITLGAVEGTSGTGAVITNTTPVSSSAMKLYASKPTVSGPSTSSGILSSGVQKIGEFTVAADTNGKIAIATTSIKIATSTSGTVNVTNVMLSDDGGATAIANSNTVAAPVSGTAFTIGFTTPYEISAGTSKTFSIYANVTGSYGVSGASSLSTQLDSTLANFLWNDVTTGSNGLTGAGLQNFGVGAYTLRN